MHENDSPTRIEDDLQGGEKNTREASSKLYGARPRIYTLLSALPRIFPSLPVSSDLLLHPFSSSSFCYFFFPLSSLPPLVYDEHVARSLHPHLDRLFVASVPKETIFNRRHSYVIIQGVLKQTYRKRNIFLCEKYTVRRMQSFALSRFKNLLGFFAIVEVFSKFHRKVCSFCCPNITIGINFTYDTSRAEINHSATKQL